MATRTPLAKLSLPRTSGALVRPRLHRLLDRAAARGAIWISSGAGTGKSTLAAAWASARPGPVLWLRADESDADPAVAFDYFRALAGARRGARLPRYHPHEVDRIDFFARAFYRAFYAAIPGAATLVVDDVHAVVGPAFAELLAAAIREAPPDVAVVILSRHDPAGPLIEALGSGALHVIDARALAFDADEAAELFAGRLERDAARRLQARTGGWAAGMLLLASDHAHGDEASPGDERIHAYFGERVLATFDPPTLRMLAAAAWLDEVDEAALIVLGFDAQAAQQLDALRRRNAFVTRLDRATPSWRLHDLLRDALRARFDSLGDASWRHSVIVAAARISAERGHLREAVHLYLRAQDGKAALALAERGARALTSAHRLAELDAIVAALPVEATDGSYALQLALGESAYQRNDAIRAVRHLEQAYALTDERAGGDRLLLAATALHAIFEGWQSYAGTERWAERLARHGDASDEIEPPQDRLRVDRARLQTADLLWDASQRDRPRLFDELLARVRHPPAGIPVDELVATSSVLLESAGFTLHDESRFHETVAATAPYLDSPELAPMTRAQWLNAFAPLGRHWPSANLRLPAPAGNPSFELAYELARAHGCHSTAFIAADHRVGGAIADNDLAAAEHWLDALRDVADPRLAVQASTLLAAEASVLGLGKQWDRALSALDRADAIAREHGHPPEDSWNRAMGRYRIWIASGRAALAHTTILRDAPSFAEGMRRDFAMILADVALAARAIDENGSVDADIVERVMTRAARYNWRGIVHFLVPVIARLCAEALRLDLETDYVRRLIAEKRLPAPSPFDPHWPWRVRIEALGGLRICVDDAPLAFGPKGQRKALDLLKLVIAHGPAPVDAAVVLDALWPDADGASARAALDMTLMRLRKLLGVDDAVQLDAGRIALAPAHVWVDAYAFMHDAIEAYAGPLFGHDIPQPWWAAARERLHQRYLRRAAQRGRTLEAQHRYADALAVYEAALVQDSLAEELYQGAIRCHLAQDRAADAMRVFRRCRDQLSIVLSVKPSPATLALVSGLRAG